MQDFSTVTKKEFLNIVKNYYNNECNIESITDLDELLKFAELHQLKGLVCHMLLCQNSKISYDKEIIKNNYISTYQTALIFKRESDKLSNFLKSKDIPFCYIKGQFIKRYYQPSEVRSMGDIDVYVRQEDMEIVKRYFADNGYNQTLYYDKVYNFRKSMVEFEIHNGIEWFGVEWANKDLFNTEIQDEIQLKLAVIHALKHIVNFGCGVRQILDIALILKSSGKKCLDGQFTDTVDKLKITKCYNTLLGVIDKWFDTCYCPDNTDKKAVECLEQVILDGGVFGVNLNDYATINIVKNKSKFKMIYSMLFPKYERMILSYPKLENKKYLLPFYYIYRLIKKGLKGKKYKEIFVSDDVQNSVANRIQFVKLLDLNEQYYNKNL